jgi:hypothetical protein
MTDHDLWFIPACPICGLPIHDNQDSIVGDDDNTYHADCLNDNPEFFDPDETIRESAEA